MAAGSVRAALAAAAMLLGALPAAAQLTNASVNSLGLSGNDTATVRGFGAISVNPAGLAMPGSEFSLALVPLRVAAAIGPVTPGDVKPFEGRLVPERTKESWLQRVLAADGQRGAVAIDVTEIALTFWNVGLQLSTLVAADVRLPPSVIEAVLFGNAGRTGAPSDVSLADVWVEGYAATSAGLSLALPLPVLEESVGQLAAGVTVKYTQGHAVAVGRSAGSLSAETLQADLDSFLIHTRIEDADIADYVNGGSGFGLDLGLMLSLDRLFVGAAVQNLFNTFAWDESLLTYRRVTAAFEDGSFSFDHGTQPYGEAPADAQELIAELTFKPALRLGAAYLLVDDFTISSDVHYRFGDGIAFESPVPPGPGNRISADRLPAPARRSGSGHRRRPVRQRRVVHPGTGEPVGGHFQPTRWRDRPDRTLVRQSGTAAPGCGAAGEPPDRGRRRGCRLGVSRRAGRQKR